MGVISLPTYDPCKRKMFDNFCCCKCIIVTSEAPEREQIDNEGLDEEMSFSVIV